MECQQMERMPTLLPFTLLTPNQLDETRMLKNVELWSPQQPKLYPIKVGELTFDRVG